MRLALMQKVLAEQMVALVEEKEILRYVSSKCFMWFDLEIVRKKLKKTEPN